MVIGALFPLMEAFGTVTSKRTSRVESGGTATMGRQSEVAVTLTSSSFSPTGPSAVSAKCRSSGRLLMRRIV